jgi:hypothetical protein
MQSGRSFPDFRHHRILRMDPSRLTRKLRIANQTDEETLNDREDGGRMVFET